MIDRLKYWEHFEHKADIGIRGVGRTFDDAFAMSAVALTEVITEIKHIQPRHTLKIHCKAPDLEILFLDWINALIYEMETRRMLFSQFKVRIHHFELDAIIKGEAINRMHHLPVVDVKGATFTELKVYQEKDVCLAQCVVDV